MDMPYRDEKTVKNQIMLLIKDNGEGISFGALLQQLNLAENDGNYLHILLLDLCRDGYLKIRDIPYDRIENVMIYSGDKEYIPEEQDKTVEYTVDASGTKTASDISDEQILREDPEKAKNKLVEPNKPEENSETESEEKTDAEYIRGIYNTLIKEVKKGPEWKSVRQLLRRGAWPKHACDVLPALLLQMANEGILEIRTEKDRISGVIPVIRYCSTEENREMSVAISQILRDVKEIEMIPEPEEQPQETEEQPGGNGNISDIIREEIISEPTVEKKVPEDLPEEQKMVTNAEGRENTGPEKPDADDMTTEQEYPEAEKTEEDISEKDTWESAASSTVIRCCSGSRLAMPVVNVPEKLAGFFSVNQMATSRVVQIFLVYHGIEYDAHITITSDGSLELSTDSRLINLMKRYDENKQYNISYHRTGYKRYRISINETEQKAANTELNDDQIQSQHDDTVQTTSVNAQIPYGYKETQNGIQTNIREAMAVCIIYKMYAEHNPLYTITDHLNSLRYRMRFDEPFTETAVSEILKREKLYRGQAVDGQRNYPAILTDQYDETSTLSPVKTRKDDGIIKKETAINTGRMELLYGYEYIDKEVRKEPNESQCVRAAFELYDSGIPRNEITGILNERGYRARNGSRITNTLVEGIIGNRQLYTGISGYPAIVGLTAKKNVPVQTDTKAVFPKTETAEEMKTPEPEKKPQEPDKKLEPEKEHQEPEKKSEPEKEPEHENKPEPINEPAEENLPPLKTQEEIQEEIFGVLFQNPGYHSIDVIKKLNGRLRRVPDYKIIFNANILHTKNLIDEIITSPPDPIMYLYSAKVQAPATQRQEEGNAEKTDISATENKRGTLSEDKDVQDFFEYCRTTPISYAYKMVLILAFFRHADSMGSMQIDDAVQFFREFYDDRRSKGLRIEKGNSIFADPSAASGSLRRNIIDNPVKALKSGGYFTYDSKSELFSMRYFVWNKLSASDKEETMNICRQRLDQYFSEI